MGRNWETESTIEEKKLKEINGGKKKIILLIVDRKQKKKLAKEDVNKLFVLLQTESIS